MAANRSQSDPLCTCPVCCDMFTDPVVLLCGHSFCENCLQEWWRQSRLRSCPVCKNLFPMSHPPRNFSLSDLCDKLRQDKGHGAGDEELCSAHGEKLKLFCQDDQQPICIICRDAQKHKKHNCVPIDEAAAEHRTELQVKLMRLKTKLGTFEAQKLENDKIVKHIRLQAEQTEKTIKEEFQRLYQFLRAQEAARVDALRKEVAAKFGAMEVRSINLQAEMSSLADKIKTIDEQLKAGDLAFMLNVKSTLEQSQCNLPQPETPLGALIDVGKHLGNLQFSVWKKMKSIIKYTPVTLDPNTCSAQWTVSENLTHLLTSSRALQLPNNPERHDSWSALGNEGFSSGKHSWDIEVDGFWSAGVAPKTKHEFHKTVCGIFMHDHNGPLLEHVTEKPVNSSSPDLLPKKLRVQLDYDRGLLSFLDLDSKTLMHKIKCTFTGPVFPYFHANVKILPAEVLVGQRPAT